MNTITTTLITEAVFSEDGTQRYLLKKTWNVNKPKLAIIMLAPSDASGVTLDTTTQLCLNNASRLGFGSIAIVNLFATLNDFALKQTQDEDPDNLKVILEASQECDQIVYAPGTGKAKNKAFLKRQEQVLTAIHPYESKLHCLCDVNGGSKHLHPLSPKVREWHLSPMAVTELVTLPSEQEQELKKKSKGRPKVTRKETATE